ncbi:MAG: bifunctional phosphoglucose/phosphomannose isomerase [Nitrososphaera sp.]
MTTVPLKEDTIQMLEKVVAFPSQISQAYESVTRNDTLSHRFAGGISNIVVMGMGASGLVGDFLRVLLRNSRVPIHVQKSGSLPLFVNGETLVIAITYSGKTRETLEALNESISRGAMNVVMTSSHELQALCSKKEIPLISVPENGFPRATLGFMLISILGVLHKLGIAPSFDSDVTETLAILHEIGKECGPEILHKSNPARLLAAALVGRFPVIYGETDFTEVAALRWKQQINENSKAHCYYDVFPELLHNEIEAWHHPDEEQVRNYALLLLRDSVHERHTGLEFKIGAAKRLAESKGAIVYDLWSRGRSELARLLSLCFLGDYVSVYLALSRGVDPGPVHNIESMKKVGFSSSKESQDV